MKATRPDWRISLEQGDRVFINVTYDVKRASWYESMGILPLAVAGGHDDPLAKDPFDDAADVQAMYDEGGVLTHGRLEENIDYEGPQGPEAAEPEEAQERPGGAERRHRHPQLQLPAPAASPRSAGSRPA